MQNTGTITIDPRARFMSLAAVMAHMIGVGLTLGLTFPLTSLTFEGWGVSEWVIGFAGSMPPLAVLVLMPVLPKVVSRMGAIRAMVIGCAIAGGALLAMYFIQTVPAWIIARFVIGAGLALPWLVGDVWINTMALETSRGKVIAAYAASFFAGFAAGPMMLDFVGLGGIAAHLLGVVSLALAVLPLLLVRASAPAIEIEAGSDVLTAMMAAPVVAAGAFLSGFTEGIAFALAPIWGLNVGYSEQISLRLLSVFIVGGIVLQLVSGSVADRMNRQTMLAITGLALAVATLLLQFAEGSAAFLLIFLSGGLVLAMYGVALTLLGQFFRPDQLAMASAAFLILYQLGSMAGPVVAGGAMAQIGPAGFLLPLGGAGLLLFAAALSRR